MSLSRRNWAAFICERPDAGSRMSREAHVRFCERAVVKFRRATRLIVFGEAHLRRILGRYAAYYNESRIHRSLDKDAPFHRAIERLGVVTSQPVRRSSSPILQNLIFGTDRGCKAEPTTRASRAAPPLGQRPCSVPGAVYPYAWGGCLDRWLLPL